MPDGSAKYVYGSTAEEADREANVLRLRVEQGERIDKSERPLSYWAQKYIEQQKVSATDVYMAGIAGRVNWWCERFGYIPVKDLVVSDLQASINELAVNNPHTKKPTGKKTLKDYRADLRRVIGIAVMDRAVSYNPADYLEIPKSAPRSKRFALTDDEQRMIRDTPHRAQLGALIMLGTGVRLGELLALRPADFDINSRDLYVSRSVVYGKGGEQPKIKKGGKTEAATRHIPIPTSLLSVLRETFRDIGEMELLYHDRNGKPLTQTAWRRIWDSYMLELNVKYGQPIGQHRSKYDRRGIQRTLRPFTPHCLRHTYATSLHTAGVDVLTAKEWLGHEDIRTTLEIYTHLSDELKNSDIKKLNEFFA